MPDRLEAVKEYARGFSRSVAERQDATSASRFVRRLHVMADEEAVACQSESERAVACSPGCDFCCHRLVEATLLEVVAAAEHVRAQFSLEDHAQFRERVQASHAANAGFWTDRQEPAKAACPFLVEHKCSVYEVRPISCRALNSFDPQPCEQKFIQSVPLERPTLATQDRLNLLTAELAQGCKEAGVRSGVFEFGPAVLTLLDHPDEIANSKRPMGYLETVKLHSELISEVEQAPRSVFEAVSKPDVRQILELRLQGAIQEVWDRTDKGSGVPILELCRLAVPPAYRSTEEMEAWWQRYGQQLASLEESGLQPKDAFDSVQVIDTFSLPYTGKNVKPYLQRFESLVHRWAEQAYPRLAASIEGPRKPGRFRLGCVSTDIRSFNGSRWALGWLRRHSPEIETFVFNVGPSEDDVSLAFRRAAGHYVHAPYLLAESAELIKAQDLDALIFTDVGMNGRTVQMAALRLARMQLNCWGHPVTSGSPTMDYYLSSELMEPPNGDDHYTEKLVRLPNSGLSLPNRTLNISSKTCGELGVPEGGFLLFAQLSHKQPPSMDGLFKRLLDQTRLPVVFLGPPFYPGILQERLAHPKAIFLPFQPAEDYLRLMQLAAASLDTPAWNGGNTCVEALSLGTPVVSMAGEFMRGRHAAAFLSLAGVGGLLAKDEDDYLSLALDPERRKHIMAGVDVGPLFDDSAPVRAIEELLLNGWQG